MSKKILKAGESGLVSNEALLSQMKQRSGSKWACCVLITCSEPAANGKMEVELNFEGDESLASFLVENASQVFEARNSLSESQ
jgi:hypothetical protein